MKTATYLLAATALALVAMPVAAADKVPTRVGITVANLGNPFFVPLVAGARETVAKAAPDADVTVVGADYDLNKQATQIDNFIASGAEVIMINSVDANAIAPAVAKAKAAGITIGAFDVTAKGADVTVMTNNFQAGQITCNYLAEQLDGTGDVAIINGPPISSIMDRVAGCKDAFSAFPGINILSDNLNGKASRDGGLDVMQGLLTRFEHIDAVFGANDPTALGADLAARQLNRDEMIIGGVDGSPDVVAALKAGNTRIVATASQDPYGMAAKSTEMALSVFRGESQPSEPILLDTELVTTENIGSYTGWGAQ